ncbi:MAG: two-component system response regulator [Bacteroidetes bacterium]|nr:two-component system response regulator [Bacteroidota bacterium]
MNNINTVDILLVEDNPYEAKLTMMSLEEQNLSKNIFHVDDGAEALDFIFCTGQYADRGRDNNPKMILLDLNMPKIGGLEVLRRIKSDDRTKSIPIIILSSSKEDSDLVTSYMLGVNSYVVKPVEFDTFTKAISDIGSYWMLLNESSVMLLLAKSNLQA